MARRTKSPDKKFLPAGRAAEPPGNCSRCPRLAAFIDDQRKSHPDWFNGPVPSFGDPSARLLIVGLAPGLKGANKTGRPFTGDYAGDLLYATLGEFGFTEGTFDARADDGLTLKGCMITNAVRCVPPANKPTGAEINTCRDFLSARIASLRELRAILVLGRIAHDSTLRMFGAKLKDHPFAHNAAHDLGPARDLAARHDLAVDHTHTLTMFDSYHCSRYNTNTGRLTTDMFRSVFKSIAEHLGSTEA